MAKMMMGGVEIQEGDFIEITSGNTMRDENINPVKDGCYLVESIDTVISPLYRRSLSVADVRRVEETGRLTSDDDECHKLSDLCVREKSCEIRKAKDICPDCGKGRVKVQTKFGSVDRESLVEREKHAEEDVRDRVKALTESEPEKGQEYYDVLKKMTDKEGCIAAKSIIYSTNSAVYWVANRIGTANACEKIRGRMLENMTKEPDYHEDVKEDFSNVQAGDFIKVSGLGKGQKLNTEESRYVYNHINLGNGYYLVARKDSERDEDAGNIHVMKMQNKEGKVHQGRYGLPDGGILYETSTKTEAESGVKVEIVNDVNPSCLLDNLSEEKIRYQELGNRYVREIECTLNQLSLNKKEKQTFLDIAGDDTKREAIAENTVEAIDDLSKAKKAIERIDAICDRMDKTYAEAKRKAERSPREADDSTREANKEVKKKHHEDRDR